jgi:Ca-activated chloride channel family protein
MKFMSCSRFWSRSRARSLCLSVVWLVAAPALAWEPFRSQNGEVLQGNEHLAKDQVPEAIAAYDAAAKRLPNEPGVHLDRGLALLKAGKLPEAREALRLASQGGQDAEVRGKAHYNLGLTFLREADAAAQQENHSEAQKLLREAADAFKSSLRASPKNRDAAWNLELTRRRLIEQEKKQQEKKQQDEEKKKQDEEKKKQDQEQQKQDGQDGQDGEKEPDPNQQQADDAGQNQGEPDAGGEQPNDPEGEQDAGAQAPEQQPPPDPNEQQPAPREGEAKPQPAMPEHMQKALDALEDGEENLQKHRAAQRARQRPRRVEKDW